MDRLICGDVGYGKTEIAIRAAFKAVDTGKQVAVLVPDHDPGRAAPPQLRRAGWPSSRSRSRSSTASGPGRRSREVLKRPAAGGVDILIGTHRLLQKDVAFKDLGLVDHRRGAAVRRRGQGMAQDVPRRRSTC